MCLQYNLAGRSKRKNPSLANNFHHFDKGSENMDHIAVYNLDRYIQDDKCSYNCFLCQHNVLEVDMGLVGKGRLLLGSVCLGSQVRNDNDNQQLNLRKLPR